MLYTDARPPTNLQARNNTGDTEVLISWIDPSPAPREYRITVDPNLETFTTPGPSPHIITIKQPGVYRIWMVGLSYQLPSETVGPVEVTIRPCTYITSYIKSMYFVSLL